jgi:hypothetical protein
MKTNWQARANRVKALRRGKNISGAYPIFLLLVNMVTVACLISIYNQ